MAERLLANEKITPIWNSVLDEVVADENGVCTAVVLKNVNTNELTKVDCKGVFVAIGHVPNTSAFKGAVDMDDEGYIIAKDSVRTSVENVFVAGDCADRDFRQAITAAASGCKAGIVASNQQ